MLLMWMSFAGLAPVILFFITWYIQKKSYNYMLGKSLIFLSLLFYIVPLPLLTRLLPNPVYYIASDMIPGMSENFHFVYGNNSYVTIQDGIMWIPNWTKIIFIAWTFCILVFSLRQVVRYQQTVAYLLSESEEIVQDGMKIRVSKDIPTACAIGFFHVHILIPEELLDSDYLPYIYRHEYCHAKNHDALIKLLCLIIVCVYWFNPLTFLLVVAFKLHCEYVSDDYAMEGCNSFRRMGYAEMLIDRTPTKSEQLPIVWRNTLTSTKIILKRRILYIMKKKKRFQKFTAAAVSMVAVLISSVAVFAYTPLQSSNEIFISGLDDGDYIDVIDESEIAGKNDSGIDFDFSNGNTIVVSEDDKFVTYEDSHADTYAICNHDFEAIRIYKHISDGEGGCQIREYKGQRCKKCNYITQGALVNVITFAVCIH